MRRTLFAVALALSLSVPARAEDFYCEVMSVEGTATLSNASTSGRALAEGDLLSVDDLVTVGASSYVDIAYDRDWNNITRVEENSSIRIRSLFPTELGLEEGGVFAKLKSLPKESTFDVKTPTAIASVRGTEYRTTYLSGETQVYNVSDSDVYVYGFDSAGVRQAEPVVIRNTEKTFIQRRGDAPMPPKRMEPQDVSRAARFQRGIEQQVMRNYERGRVGKLPDVGAIEKRMEQRRAGQEEGPGKGLRSNEGGPRPGEVERPKEGAPQKAADAPVQARGGALVSGAGTQERRPQENRFEGRGIGEPFFPGDERHRSGGPEPAGMPDRRWKSADENAAGENPNQGQPGQEPRMDKRPEGQSQQGMRQPGQGGGQDGKNPQGKPQSRGGARPQPRRT